MKKILSIFMVMALMIFSSLAVARTASAEDFKTTGTITKIEISADKKSAIAIVKDGKSETSVTITVTDELTLDKFMDKRIVEGDEIRTKYEKSGDTNTSKMFKKTAGC